MHSATETGTIMKILFLEWKSFGNEDMIAAFEELGHTVKTCPFSNREVRENAQVEAGLVAEIRSFSPDFVFSFNYFPIVSLACKKVDMRYVSWIYDSPYVMLYSYTIIYPGNFIFVFDRELFNEFHSAGISTVHYLPLAANTDRLSSMTDNEAFQKSIWKNQTEIAFVGSLYTENHRFYDRLTHITPYTRGYLEGIMAAQKQVYGYNFIQELLNADIISDLEHSLPMQPDAGGVETVEYLYAQYVINRQITATERSELLSALGAVRPYDLYTPDRLLSLPGGVNHGPVDYYEMAPYVFKHACINLNMTLRSIKSGIPLRAFDIMGTGGFLLTNYQADFLDDFVPGEDFAFYESRQNFLDQIDYYLSHADEREAIAANGFQKVAKHHTYKHRAAEILSYLN